MQITDLPKLVLKWLRDELRTAHLHSVSTSFSYLYVTADKIATINLREDIFGPFDDRDIVVEVVKSDGSADTIRFPRKELGTVLYQINDTIE